MLTNRERKKVLGVIVGRDDCSFKTAKETYKNMTDDERLELLPEGYAPMTVYEIKRRLEIIGHDLSLIGITAFLTTNEKKGPVLKINTIRGPEVAVVYFANDDIYKLFVGGKHYKTSPETNEIIDAIDFIVF